MAAARQPDGDRRRAHGRPAVREHGVSEPGRRCADLPRPGRLAGAVRLRRLARHKPYWSPRIGVNYDLSGNQSTQIRGGSGIFTGKPPYVWISNQIGNTGVLSGFIDNRNTSAFPFTPNPDRYKPAPTGGAASSYELDVTDADFRFPQTWRTNVGFDQRLPWGMIGTMDFIYNRDLNAPVYINANLPAPQSAFTGADTRPRWVATAAFPACATTGGQAGPCVTRLNNAPGNQITAAYVIKNQSENRSWNYSASLSKTGQQRLRVQGRVQLRRVREHGRAVVHGRQFVGVGEPDPLQPEQPGSGLLAELAGQAVVPADELFARATSASARRRSRCSTRAGTTATPATSSPATPTATRSPATT